MCVCVRLRGCLSSRWFKYPAPLCVPFCLCRLLYRSSLPGSHLLYNLTTIAKTPNLPPNNTSTTSHHGQDTALQLCLLRVLSCLPSLPNHFRPPWLWPPLRLAPREQAAQRPHAHRPSSELKRAEATTWHHRQDVEQVGQALLLVVTLSRFLCCSCERVTDLISSTAGYEVPLLRLENILDIV